MLSSRPDHVFLAKYTTDLNVPLCAVSTLAVLLFLNLKKPPMEGTMIENLAKLDWR